MYETPQEILLACLSSSAVTAAQIEMLRTKHPKEGLHHDFKAGVVAAGKGPEVKEGRRRLVECVLSMANAEGGLVVVGIKDDADRPYDGFPSDVRDENEWLHGLLKNYWGMFTRSPRVDMVAVGAGEASHRVAVIVVPPSDSFIVHSDGTMTLRTTGGSFTAPDYMVRALVLGTRNHPNFSLTGEVVFRNVGKISPPGNRGGVILPVRRYELMLRALNTSLAWAEDPVLGIAWWRLHEVGDVEVPPPAVILRVRLAPPPTALGSYEIHADSWQLMHTKATSKSLSPIEQVDALKVALDAIVPAHVEQWTLRAAAYVIARNAVPRWYQVDVVSDALEQCTCTIAPTHDPVVTWLMRSERS